MPSTPSGAHLVRIDLNEAAPSNQLKGQLARPGAAPRAPRVAQQQRMYGRSRRARIGRAVERQEAVVGSLRSRLRIGREQGLDGLDRRRVSRRKV